MNPHLFLFHICEIGETKVQSRLGVCWTSFFAYILCCPQLTPIISKAFLTFTRSLNSKCKLCLKIHFLSVSTSNSTNNFKGILGILMEENAWHSKSMGEMMFHFTHGRLCKKAGRRLLKVSRMKPLREDYRSKVKRRWRQAFWVSVWALWLQISYFLRHSFFVYRMRMLIPTE